MTDRKPIRRALVSVYNKVGLVEIGSALHAEGVEILSTGSTAKTLVAAGIPVTAVEEYTGFPEMLGGRVKTLHPRVHGGILADQSNPDHLRQLSEHDIDTFDLVVINLYPFSETIASGADFVDCIEQIDIGGPSMLRGAAKNHESVAVVGDPSLYPMLLSAISSGGFTQAERKYLAMQVFRKTAEYDSAIASWLGEQLRDTNWRNEIRVQSAKLRYGENPHQTAALFVDPNSASVGIAKARQLHGKEMSFNNYTDGDAALRAAYDHSDPCVAIIKHANPCGIALGETISQAHQRAHACDPVSAFGGVVAANREVSVEMANQLSEIFTEVVIAPSFATEALEVLMKKANIRLLELPEYSLAPFEVRPISGGTLIQDSDRIDADGDSPEHWQQVSGQPVSAETLRDLSFAWRSVRAVKSNAILLAKDQASVGVGMGQVNRVDSAGLAVSRAGDRAKGSVAASDAFFPFADGLQILLDAGVAAVVQPGGSVRDAEVIAAAQAANVPMFFTGVRHFSHA